MKDGKKYIRKWEIKKESKRRKNDETKFYRNDLNIQFSLAEIEIELSVALLFFISSLVFAPRKIT